MPRRFASRWAGGPRVAWALAATVGCSLRVRSPRIGLRNRCTQAACPPPHCGELRARSGARGRFGSSRARWRERRGAQSPRRKQGDSLGRPHPIRGWDRPRTAVVAHAERQRQRSCGCMPGRLRRRWPTIPSTSLSTEARRTPEVRVVRERSGPEPRQRMPCLRAARKPCAPLRARRRAPSPLGSSGCAAILGAALAARPVADPPRAHRGT